MRVQFAPELAAQADLLLSITEVRHGVDLSGHRRPVRDQLGDWPEVHRGPYTPSTLTVDHCQHDSEYRAARTGAQDIAGRHRLCGVDRDRSSRYRGARDLPVRRAGD